MPTRTWPHAPRDAQHLHASWAGQTQASSGLKALWGFWRCVSTSHWWDLLRDTRGGPHWAQHQAVPKTWRLGMSWSSSSPISTRWVALQPKKIFLVTTHLVINPMQLRCVPKWQLDESGKASTMLTVWSPPSLAMFKKMEGYKHNWAASSKAESTKWTGRRRIPIGKTLRKQILVTCNYK